MSRQAEPASVEWQFEGRAVQVAVEFELSVPRLVLQADPHRTECWEALPSLLPGPVRDQRGPCRVHLHILGNRHGRGFTLGAWRGVERGPGLRLHVPRRPPRVLADDRPVGNEHTGKLPPLTPRRLLQWAGRSVALVLKSPIDPWIEFPAIHRDRRVYEVGAGLDEDGLHRLLMRAAPPALAARIVQWAADRYRPGLKRIRALRQCLVSIDRGELDPAVLAPEAEACGEEVAAK